MIKKYTVTVNGKKYEVEVESENAAQVQPAETAPAPKEIVPEPVLSQARKDMQASSKKISSPMPGTVLRVNVKLGSEVKAGDPLLVLESMKMENEITAPEDGRITAILAQEGVRVKTGDALIAYN